MGNNHNGDAECAECAHAHDKIPARDAHGYDTDPDTHSEQSRRAQKHWERPVEPQAEGSERRANSGEGQPTEKLIGSCVGAPEHTARAQEHRQRPHVHRPRHELHGPPSSTGGTQRCGGSDCRRPEHHQAARAPVPTEGIIVTICAWEHPPDSHGAREQPREQIRHQYGAIWIFGELPHEKRSGCARRDADAKQHHHGCHVLRSKRCGLQPDNAHNYREIGPKHPGHLPWHRADAEPKNNAVDGREHDTNRCALGPEITDQAPDAKLEQHRRDEAEHLHGVALHRRQAGPLRSQAPRLRPHQLLPRLESVAAHVGLETPAGDDD
mmetsp:Transcript_2916/g.7837  ORF Transcript_2916/g.7837 Transcript_2916/m.7837 type:complete len:324 (+) Transcript_2916:346-1317(+)